MSGPGGINRPNVAQKWDGTMIYDVTDTGKNTDMASEDQRRSRVSFHTDNAFGISVPTTLV